MRKSYSTLLSPRSLATPLLLGVLLVAGACGDDAAPECVVASDCMGQDTACQQRTCSAEGTCELTLTAAGTPLGTQPIGDCHLLTCDGAGGTTDAVDDTDLPDDDGNECTDEVCTAGTPEHPPSPATMACGAGLQCDGAGACLGCLAPSDCPGVDDDCQTRTCSASMCGLDFTAAGTVTSTQAAGDCRENRCDGAGAAAAVIDDTDLPVDDGLSCTSEACTAGVPTYPAVADGTACSDADACTQADTCQSGVCTGATSVVCSALDQCHVVGTCDPVTGTCSNPGAVDGTTCDDGDTCTPADTCQAAACAPGAPLICTALDECHLAGTCTSGSGCSDPPAPAGTACTTGGGTVCDGSGACVVPAPEVVSTTPADGASGVARSSTVAVTFSMAMAPATLIAQTSSGACAGTLQVSTNEFVSCIGFAAAAPSLSGGDTIATVTPAPGLAYGSTYKIRVTTGAQSATAIALAADYTSATGFTTAGPDLSCSSGLVISQVYGGGGNAGSYYRNDFIELYNGTAAPINLTGYSVQYASAVATGTWTVANTTNLTGTIAAGGYFLVQEAAGTGGVAFLPTADVIGTIAMGATGGKVALVSSATPLTGTVCPAVGAVVDFVGYGGATCFEGTAATPAPSNTLSVSRANDGCTDTNQNGADFTAGFPTPRNSATSTAALNESGTAAEADYCVLQFPLSLAATTGTPTALIYGRIFEAGVTEPAGAPAGIQAQVGYGPTTANPEWQIGWLWFPASFNMQFGNDDEFQGSFTAPAVGTYSYTYRFSADGVHWTYCDTNGAGSDVGQSFETTQLPTLTVTP